MFVFVIITELPQRQEAGFEQDGPQGPLDLLVINQLCRFQTPIVGGETETGVQYFKHPGGFKTLMPGSEKNKWTGSDRVTDQD